MFPWGTNPKKEPSTSSEPSITGGQGSGSATPGTSKAQAFRGRSGRPSLRLPSTRMAVPRWLQVLPFFLSSLFFVSGLLSVFSLVPLLFVYFHSGRKWAWLSVLTNSAAVYFLAGRPGLVLYSWAVVGMAMLFAECLVWFRKLEISFMVTLGGTFAILLAGIGLFLYRHHIQPVDWIQGMVAAWVDQVGSSLSGSGMMSAADLDDLKHNLAIEFPGAVVILAFLVLMVNFIILYRLNPGSLLSRLRLDSNLLTRWKTPEWLVWPTILSGAGVLFDLGAFSQVSINLFKFLMAIYFFHGASILTFYFEKWSVRGLFRSLLLLVGVLFALPGVLGLGFFDLWFDFRNRVRQS